MTSKLILPNYLPDQPGVQPPFLSPEYKSTVIRSPMREPIDLPQRLTEITNPVYGVRHLNDLENDLTKQHEGEPQGQRVIVYGKVIDSNNQPVKNTLIEIWQTNAGGRYRHVVDNWDSPLDPNFSGVGRTTTNEKGEYEFITIKPGAYPWRNHHNAWRPAHIHFSLFGRAFVQRLVTQMYFPEDPLFSQDPIFNSITDPKARERLISTFDLDRTIPSWALAFNFNIVLRGSNQTPFEEEEDDGDVA